jgi:hypothetical protein
MARKSGPDLAKYAKLFDKHMSKVDELTLAVLKGHLIIEGALDDILATIFFYPGHVDAARLGLSGRSTSRGLTPYGRTSFLFGI